jgi:hypothetical protein
MKRLAVLLLCSSALAGCDTVHLQYKTPATAEADVLADADAGYHYFALPRTYILVAPEAGQSQSSDGNKPASGGGKPPNGSVPQGVNGAGKGGVVKNKPHKGGQNTSGSGSSSSSSGSDSGSVKNDAGNGNPPAQTSGSNPAKDLAKTQIGDTTWVASAVPMPDDANGLMVRGISGFWQSTTLGVGRYDNSDMPNTISSKAENLVPKRIGQLATALTTIMSISAAFGVENTPGGVTSQPPPSGPALKPFTLPVEASDTSGSLDGGWSYSLHFDSTIVPDAMSFEKFKTDVDGKYVRYWPVPACRGVTLTLTPPGTASSSVIDHKPTFHLSVGTPDYVRPETLPVDGSLDLGTVCSGSAKGTMNADAASDAMADLQALQDAVSKLKPGGSGASGGQPKNGQ